MTLKEFRLWLDGFCQAVEGCPTPQHWEKIKLKLAQEIKEADEKLAAELNSRKAFIKGEIQARLNNYV